MYVVGISYGLLIDFPNLFDYIRRKRTGTDTQVLQFADSGEFGVFLGLIFAYRCTVGTGSL